MSMHESAARLYAAATKDGKAPRQADLARQLNVSSQVVKNWEARGLSVHGALTAEAVFGISPTWLLSGVRPKRPDEPLRPPAFGLAPYSTQEPMGRWSSSPLQDAEILVWKLAQRLEQLPEDAQRRAQAALSALAGAPDSKRAREALTRALDPGAVTA